MATDRALEILRFRGELPRQKQNRLIFLAADYDAVSRLRDQVRSVLAWQSIVDDSREMRLNLDQFQLKQANQSLTAASEALGRMVRETYKWILSPMQEPVPGKGVSEIRWEYFPINAGAPNMAAEILRVLKENEILITEWAPVHLAKLLKDWFWKDAPEAGALDVWQKTCAYLYMPRLKDDTVYKLAIEAGSESRDFFGLAQGKEGDQYIGFTFGKRTGVFLDNSLLLVEPAAAAAFEAQKQAAQRTALQPEPGPGGFVREDPPGGGGYGGGTVPPVPPAPPAQPAGKKHFYGSIDLDPVRAKLQFNNLVDEVIGNFTVKPGVRVKIAIEIEAETDAGFDDSLQRAVKENCNALKFKTAEFEE
ncbi:hypothetical protein [Sporomusa carbonis]|uniref:hypothetical protein n=1 Tax=Sporomusa carbonis TaxID=3076075 RepID=UPI003C7B79E4